MFDDYSTHFVSDDYSEEDNYAGAHGYFDDYDEYYYALDFGDREFGFDQETYLFQFDPFVEYFDLKDESDVVTMTYQSLMEVTEMTYQLLKVWKKRSSVEQDVKITQDEPFHGLNLYQLGNPKERDKLKTYSVVKLLGIFESNEEVSKFEEEVNQMRKFLRKCFLDILAQCLPSSMPYPVVNTILSHLQTVEGLHKVGVVTKLKCSKIMEEEYMGKLYLSMANVYDHLKVVMFNIEPNTHSTEPSLTEGKASLLARFSLLVEFVNSFNIESGLDSFQIVNEIETNPGGGLEMLEKLGQAGVDGEQFVGHSELELIKKIVKEDENQEFGQEYPELDEKRVELNKEKDTGKESLIKGGQEEGNQIEL
eukprot:GFUD01041424.1.p1 GENE.GFUD01041424.1~~GFUD01041424.1.p1  ORF type:complete len:365 (+),score=119.59 GFUD01041424.1:109-1203(+)